MIVRSAPAITRVHTLHRIRTVVNHVNDLAKAGEQLIDDRAVAEHLIDTLMSKPTTDKFGDQIGRRARDHLETARYLGLVYRIRPNRRFTHMPTPWGAKLDQYAFEHECPRDPLEEAILVDRVARMKMTNASYSQAAYKYKKWRSRPILSLLVALEITGGLNVLQLGYVLAESSVDPYVRLDLLKTLLEQCTSKDFQVSYLSKLTATDVRNVNRNTRPLIDWCLQLNLVRREDVDQSEIFAITPRGQAVARFYSALQPLWWADMGYWEDLGAAVVLLVNYFILSGQPKRLEGLAAIEGQAGLFKGSFDQVLKNVTTKSLEEVVNDRTPFDFSLHYDVPPDLWDFVVLQIGELIQKASIRKLRAEDILRAIEWQSIEFWEAEFTEQAQQVTQEQSRRFALPVQINTASIHAQFTSPWEGATYIFLVPLQKPGFTISRYQGQLADFFADDPKWARLARSNPDLLATNDFCGLVECKSTAEWGERLSLNKGIEAELCLYNDYAQAVEDLGLRKKCSAVFVYEGAIAPDHQKDIIQFLEAACPKVLILVERALKRALVDQPYANELRAALADSHEARAKHGPILAV